MIPARARAPLVVAFFVALHALVLVALWRRDSGGIARGVVLVSVIPLSFAGPYLLRHLTRPLSWLDVWVLAYAGWSIASVVLFAQAGNPSRVPAYAYGLYHFVLPIACYFMGKALSRPELRAVLGGLVLLNAFAMAYGLYLHLVRPEYYVTFVTNALTSAGATEEWQYFARLQSYLGSTTMGYLGATSIVLASLASGRIRRILPLLALLFAVGASLSLQRASLVALMLALAYLLFAFREHRMLRLVTLATFAAAMAYGTIRLGAAVEPLLQSVRHRATTGLVEGLSSFVDERGYRPGWRYLSRFPLGLGVGATSSAAENAGYVGEGEVADANFMRIAADLGILGLALFLLVLTAMAARAWRSPNRVAWATFLLIHCGIMLSTNVFDSFYVSHSFWLLAAYIDRDGETTELRDAVSSPAPAFPPAAARSIA